MKIKAKILLVLIIGCLGVFFDDLAYRLAKLERQQQRVTKLAKGIEELHLKVRDFPKLQRELVDQTPWGNQVKLLTHEIYIPTAAVQELPDLFELSSRYGQVQVFRTAPRDPLSDTTLSSYPSHQNQERGGHEVLYLGSENPNYVSRVLISFSELQQKYFKNKKILAAVLYLKQIPNDPAADDHLSWAGVVNLYAVKKAWNPGRRGAGEVDKGSACWLYARAQEEPWTVPGCSDPKFDYDSTLLATSGPVLIGETSDWLPIVFTDQGILYLQRWAVQKNNLEYGFLLKAENENLEHALSAFHSGNSRTIESRPFLEIYYTNK